MFRIDAAQLAINDIYHLGFGVFFYPHKLIRMLWVFGTQLCKYVAHN